MIEILALSLVAVTVSAQNANSCDISLSADLWNAKSSAATTWGSETVINAGNWIESKQTFTRPIQVEAEMMSASSAECITLSLFATDHGKNSPYALETGAWSNLVRMHPGDKIVYGGSGKNDIDWQKVSIKLTE